MRRRMLKALLGAALRIRVAGNRDALAAPGPLLIVANHPAAFDPLVLAQVLGADVHIMASKGAMASRLCRWGWSAKQVTVVDLSHALTVRKLARLVGSGAKVLVFPQNRPTRPGEVGKIYEAPAIVAARTGVPVVTLDIRYGEPGAGGSWRDDISITFGRLIRIQPGTGLPARERRRRATDELTRALQETTVAARPRYTLFAAFVRALNQQGRRRRIVEDIREVEESYGGLLKISLALGRMLGRVTSERDVVGLLLPNTVATIGALLGLSAMGRVPAMLNYSAGPDALRASVGAACIRKVVTSRRFIEAARLTRLVSALAPARVLYLEDLRAELRFGDKLWLVAWALWRPMQVARRRSPEEIALVLFTSGSEGKPKGVALSHDAVLANMAQLAAAIDFGPRDKFLNALPMYHTYGLIACTLMPLVYGTKLFLYTNPLHYRIVPEIAYSRSCTYLFGTSTFLGNYARHARALDFTSVRYVICGGEKLNPEVQRVYQERFGLRVLEGYGSTECGPAVSLATPQRYRAGTVGCLLAGVDHRIVPVAGIESGGVLHVRSPNTMLGYLTAERPGELQKFDSELGEGWYNMGDVVSVDDDGFITVLGRLKRFAKVAGEMVALELVERLARDCSPHHQHAATVAMMEGRGETTVLFTTDKTLERLQLHHAARASGAQDLAVARTIVHVDSLPVLGTGKTDYVTLAQMAYELPAGTDVTSRSAAGQRATQST